MFAEISQIRLSPPVVLWLVFSLIAAMLLFSGLHRRRSRLTDALRSFVQRSQDAGSKTEKEKSKKKT
tara:strand:- start:22817 stop:23017 length:201 start_codon:yes stop_codon:yes gene_type:complete